jgi:hypothetical protein
MWKPRRLTTLWASTACYRDSFTLPFYLGCDNVLPGQGYHTFQGAVIDEYGAVIDEYGAMVER